MPSLAGPRDRSMPQPGRHVDGAAHEAREGRVASAQRARWRRRTSFKQTVISLNALQALHGRRRPRVFDGALWQPPDASDRVM